MKIFGWEVLVGKSGGANSESFSMFVQGPDRKLLRFKTYKIQPLRLRVSFSKMFDEPVRTTEAVESGA